MQNKRLIQSIDFSRPNILYIADTNSERASSWIYLKLYLKIKIHLMLI